MQNLKCQQCGRHIDSDNHSEQADVIGGKKEKAVSFCNRSCLIKFLMGEESSAVGLKDFQSEVADDE